MPYRRLYGTTYIRAWRVYRGLSLRDLASAIDAAAGQRLISYASLGRIERGLQPYSQPILEAAAVALATHPAALLIRAPDQGEDIYPLWEAMDARQRARAVAILRVLMSFD